MPDNSSSATEPSMVDQKATGTRVVQLGIVAIVVILTAAAIMLFVNLPDANAFNDRVEQIFVENDALTSGEAIRLLEVLAQSGTSFSEVLASYRAIIFVLLVFATALLVACLIFVVTIVAQNRRMEEIEKKGLQVSSLVLSREQRMVLLNNMEFKLTDAAMETLSVLAEARMDDDVLTGAEIEAMVSGRNAADCDEAAGATRIKRLRDALGNQMVSELLIRNIARRGYMLSIDKDVISMT
ncbi:MAG: helix-turn-helix domain-containing protein [Pseudomonadota bacterium]